MNWRLIIFSFFILLFYSCHKEYSCENCIQGGPGSPGPQNPQAAVIASLDCAGGTFSAAAIEATSYSGQYILSYAGGNGASYKADTITSTGVTGLTAILVTGTLANGNGSLIYQVSGTPASAGSATFPISIGGKS